MVFWKRFAGITAVTVLAASLAACGANQGAADNTKAGNQNASSNAPVKLRIMWWGSQQRHEVTLKALDAYTKAHPNITFSPEYSGMTGYLDKLSTQAAAKNAPDIIQLDPGWVADWVSRNQLVDLSSIDLSNVDPKVSAVGKFGNKQYAIPLGSVAEGMIYDKAALDKLGAAAPKNGWTWDDFFNMAEQLKPKLAKGQYFAKDYAGDYFAYSAYQYAAGKGELVTEAGKFNVDQPTFIDWANKWQKLRQDGLVPPADVNASDKELDPSGDLMVKGTILTRLGFSNNLVSWDSIKPGAYDEVTMPRAQQAGGWIKPSMFFAVSSNSKNAEEAKKFIDWFINNEDVGKTLGTTRGVPVNNKVAAAIVPTMSAADKAGQVMYTATLKDGQQWKPGAPGWTNWIDKDWPLVSDELSFGKKTPEQAYAELKSAAQNYQS